MKIIKFFKERFWNSPTFMTWGNMLINSTRLLLITPLILVNYNVHEIAFWYLLATINSFIIVVDFGFSSTFSRVISYAFNGLESINHSITANQEKKLSSSNKSPNWVLLERIYGTVNITYTIQGILVILIIFGSTFFSVKEVIDKYPQQSAEFWNTYIIFCLGTFLGFFAKKFDSVIIGTNNVVLINRWDLLNGLLSVVASAVIVFLKLSILYLSVNLLFFALILVLRDFFLERKICNGKFKEFKFFSFDKEVFKWCWGPTWRSGILIMLTTGVTQATGFIYSHYSNAANLAAYLLTLKLITTVSQFSQAPFYSKIPVFNGLRVKGNINEFISRTSDAMKKVLFVFVIGAGCLILFGNPLLHFIHSRSQLIDNNILILMSFVWLLDRHHSMHAQIYITTNKVPFVLSTIITSVVNIGLIIVLLPHLGVIAFPISQGIANLVLNNWWNVKLSLESMHTSIKYLKKNFAPALIVLIVISIASFFLVDR